MSPRVQLSVANVLAEIFRALRKDLLDPYRPERHYMRGPGPKWRLKHAAHALDPASAWGSGMDALTP